jgi:Ca2+-binding RTX toxin-like protein
MGRVAFGPGLAGFPAFPLLPLDALADPGALPPEELARIQAIFAALDFRFTDDSFRFQLDSTLFGVAETFRFEFSFGGDFASLAADPSQLLNAFNPALAANFLVRFETAETVDAINGRLAIAAEADAAGPPIPFALFFGTLLDPRNFTQNLLATFTGGDLAQFDTLDLSAFGAGVVMGRPNGATVAREGTISRPDGGFVDSDWGVVSFAGEVRDLVFSRVLGGPARDVLASGVVGGLVAAGGGDDVVVSEGLGGRAEGGEGADLLVAAAAGVTLLGGPGRDVLVADAAGVTLDGGDGDDLLFLGEGRATGGAGADQFVTGGARGLVSTIADFDPAEDRLLLPAGLSPAAPWVRLGAGADGTLELALPDGQRVRFEGLGVADADAVRAALERGGSTGAVRVAVAGGGEVTAPAGGTAVGRSGDDRLTGTGRDEVLLGGAGDDRLDGRGGSDLLLGGDGADWLDGGAGDDVLDGGDGDDVISGGRGFDIVSGGPGADRFVLGDPRDGYDRIADIEPGVDRVDLSALLGGRGVNAGNFDSFVRVVPLGPTELTGFILVDRDGPGRRHGFEVLAQLDGAAFAIVGGQSVSQLTGSDFLFG